MQSDLIRIGSDRVKAIRAHDLHQALGIRSRLTTWIDREIAKHDLVDRVDYVDAVARRTDTGRRDAWFAIATASRIASSTQRATTTAVIQAIDDIARAPIIVDEVLFVVDDDASPMEEWSPPKVTTEIVDGVERLTANLRDLHRSLRVVPSYEHWSAQRIKPYEIAVPGWEISEFLQKAPTGQPVIEKIVTLSLANDLAMLEDTPIGRRIRGYFMDCEQHLRTVAADLAAAEAKRLQDDLRALSAELDKERRRNARPASDATRPIDVEPRTANRDRIATLNRLLDMPNMTASILETVTTAFNIRSPSTEAPTDQTDEGTGDQEPVHLPAHLFATSVGVVIDLRLPVSRTAEIDKAAALRHVGCPGIDRRTLTFWERAYDDPGHAAERVARGETPQLGLAEVNGVTHAMRRAVVETYRILRHERVAATVAWTKSRRQSLARNAHESAWLAFCNLGPV